MTKMKADGMKSDKGDGYIQSNPIRIGRTFYSGFRIIYCSPEHQPRDLLDGIFQRP